jgi:hypothetical protein
MFFNELQFVPFMLLQVSVGQANRVFISNKTTEFYNAADQTGVEQGCTLNRVF